MAMKHKIFNNEVYTWRELDSWEMYFTPDNLSSELITKQYDSLWESRKKADWVKDQAQEVTVVHDYDWRDFRVKLKAFGYMLDKDYVEFVLRWRLEDQL